MSKNIEIPGGTLIWHPRVQL